MSLLVAYAPDEHGAAALHLAAMLARSAGDDLVVCTVVPAPWVPGVGRVDAEYQDYLDQTAQQALDRARTSLPGDVPASYRVQHARSAPAGLLTVAEETGAAPIVLGSSSDGRFGHVALGAVTARMAHSSPVPLVLATRGFRCRPDARVRRVTVAYGGPEGADEVVAAGRSLADRLRAPLRIATFVVRPRPVVTAGVGPRAEDDVVQEWAKGLSSSDAVLAHGEGWADALDAVEWSPDGELLVVGSSSIGPLAQVFLGSRAAKIVRHSPVPVVLVARG